jgi:hypothetical protein
MDFLLESCFQLDTNSQTAELIPDCNSGVYAENQIVSLGPHRFYRQDPPPQQQEEVAGAAELEQAGLVVDHAGVECIVVDQFPMFNAVIIPIDEVQSARVYFRAAQHPDYYYIVMQQEGNYFVGILPKPGPDTQQVIYYIEAVDLEFNMSQSQEHAPNVTTEDACKRRDPGAAYFVGDDPGIIVGATVAGVAAVPAGFQAAGIAGFISAAGAVSTAAAVGAAAAAGGAGLGTVGTVIVVAGSAAAAGGVVTATTGGTDEEEASVVQ